MSVPAMKPETEKKLARVLDDVATLVEEGASPNDAIIKAAKQHSVIPGHISLLAAAYNTGRFDVQRDSSDDPVVKAADFPLADAAEILETLYPSEVPTRAERTKSAAISEEYDYPPTVTAGRDMQHRQKTARYVFDADEPEITKCASALAAERKPYPPSAREALHKKASRLELEETEAKRQAQAMLDHLLTQQKKLAHYFRTPQALPYDSVRENAIILFGETGEKLMDWVKQSSPVITKRAYTTPEQHAVRPTSEPYATIISCMNFMKNYQEARQIWQKKAEELPQQLLDLLGPAPQIRPTRQYDEGILEKDGGIFGDVLGGAVGGWVAAPKEVGRSLPGGKPTAALEQGMYEKLTDPTHEAEMRSIKVQAMLNDLMANDDVISQADPQEVMEHFNELSQMAPRAVEQPMMVRAQLRKRLQQGSADPYEADLLLKAENSLRQRESAAPQHSDEGGGGGVLG